MEHKAAAPSHSVKVERKKSHPSPAKGLWRRIRKPLAESRFVKQALASLLAGAIRMVERTNPPVSGSHDLKAAINAYSPAIIALWHGQHLLAPAINPRGHKVVALFSRSADAELNALVARKFGCDVVRGSGGRQTSRSNKKGGAAALIALKKAIDRGCNVVMIADIPHGTPRQAGLGIVTLARLSGRPIIPVAIATSRRKVLEGTWDKTTVNLPFGRRAVVLEEPIEVAPEAGEGEMEEKRRRVTEALNRATEEAYALVDGPRP